VIAPLKKATEYGHMMNDPFGNSKYCFTLLATYVTDTLEACVLSCVHSSTSHVTMAKSSQFSNPFCHPSHTADATLSCLATITALTSPDDLPEYFKACKDDCLNGVNAPFWWNWALTEPYIVFGLEVLHHFHKMFWDHDLQWAINLVGTMELDF
ncbi:hypothetical protein EDC04DRAFT_2571408, partial [Pisolithus marmoratus]